MKTNRWVVAFGGMLLPSFRSAAATAAQYAGAARAGARLLPAGQMHAVMNTLTLSGFIFLAFGILAAWLLANPTSAAQSTEETSVAGQGHSSGAFNSALPVVALVLAATTVLALITKKASPSYAPARDRPR